MALSNRVPLRWSSREGSCTKMWQWMDNEWFSMNISLSVSSQFCYKLRGTLLLSKLWEAQVTLSQRSLVCREFIRKSFSNNTRLGCRSGQESWTVIQLQQRPKLILSEALKLAKPFKDVLNWGEGTGLLYLHINQSLGVWLPPGSLLNLGWGSSLFLSAVPYERLSCDPWAASTPRQLGMSASVLKQGPGRCPRAIL